MVLARKPLTAQALGSSFLLPAWPGMVYAQSHPSTVATSSAFTGDRVGCPQGTLATGKEMSLREEQREVGERAEI